MADTVLTLMQIENIFQSWTSQALNTTDPSVVRIGWPADGAPSQTPSEDVVYLFIRYDDNPYTHQVQTDYSEYDSSDANVNLVYTAGIRMTWNLYGPSAFDNVDVIRSQLFTDATRTTLQADNIALVTDVPMAIRTPELFNGQWFNRATLSASFNEMVIRQSTVPYIQTATLQTEEG